MRDSYILLPAPLYVVVNRSIYGFSTAYSPSAVVPNMMCFSCSHGNSTSGVVAMGTVVLLCRMISAPRSLHTLAFVRYSMLDMVTWHMQPVAPRVSLFPKLRNILIESVGIVGVFTLLTLCVTRCPALLHFIPFIQGVQILLFLLFGVFSYFCPTFWVLSYVSYFLGFFLLLSYFLAFFSYFSYFMAIFLNK